MCAKVLKERGYYTDLYKGRVSVNVSSFPGEGNNVVGRNIESKESGSSALESRSIVFEKIKELLLFLMKRWREGI